MNAVLSAETGVHFFICMCICAFGQPPIQSSQWVHSTEIKQQGCGDDQLSPTSSKVNLQPAQRLMMCGAIPILPPISSQQSMMFN